jgi:predicted lactoylglutathione lyase
MRFLHLCAILNFSNLIEKSKKFKKKIGIEKNIDELEKLKKIVKKFAIDVFLKNDHFGNLKLKKNKIAAILDSAAILSSDA